MLPLVRTIIHRVPIDPDSSKRANVLDESGSIGDPMNNGPYKWLPILVVKVHYGFLLFPQGPIYRVRRLLTLRACGNGTYLCIGWQIFWMCMFATGRA